MPELKLTVPAAACASLLASPIAGAHASLPVGEGSSAELLVAGIPMLAAAILYILGALRVSPGVPRIVAFTAGWLSLAAALMPPLDPLGAELFSLHMVQHEVLMLVAAPLLVLGRPLPVFIWAFPTAGRETLGRLVRARSIRIPWRTLNAPLVAWALHAAAVWIWHAPALFDAALASRALHDAQHLSFVLTALLFWSALLQARLNHLGAAVLYLFTTTVHTSVLGALITFARTPWYQSYLETAHHRGFTPLEDQQLGGLIMWVPGSLVYVGFGLALFARWLQHPGGRHAMADRDSRAPVHSGRGE
jgi:putative membrane protein